MVLDEGAARKAIKQFIAANQDFLLDSIVQQGNDRKIKHNTVSLNTPPTGYFYIATYCTAPTLYSTHGKLKQVSSLVKAQYPTTIMLVDYVSGHAGEDELFEQAELDFLLFTDRLVNLIYETARFTDEDTNKCFTIEKSFSTDRLITKSNRETNWTEAEVYHAVKFCEISFTLEGC